MAVLQAGMNKKALRLHPEDNCVVSLMDIRKGDPVVYEGGTIVANSDIDIGHKISICTIKIGEKVYKYGASIGSATAVIEPGDHIHTQNLTSDYIVGFHH